MPSMIAFAQQKGAGPARRRTGALGRTGGANQLRSSGGSVPPLAAMRGMPSRMGATSPIGIGAGALADAAALESAAAGAAATTSAALADGNILEKILPKKDRKSTRLNPVTTQSRM